MKIMFKSFALLMWLLFRNRANLKVNFTLGCPRSWPSCEALARNDEQRASKTETTPKITAECEPR